MELHGGVITHLNYIGHFSRVQDPISHLQNTWVRYDLDQSSQDFSRCIEGVCSCVFNSLLMKCH